MTGDLTDIRERLARIETRQELNADNIEKGFANLGAKMESFDTRLRAQETKSAVYGSVAGGVVSVSIAYITAKLKGGA